MNRFTIKESNTELTDYSNVGTIFIIKLSECKYVIWSPPVIWKMLMFENTSSVFSLE